MLLVLGSCYRRKNGEATMRIMSGFLPMSVGKPHSRLVLPSFLYLTKEACDVLNVALWEAQCIQAFLSQYLYFLSKHSRADALWLVQNKGLAP